MEAHRRKWKYTTLRRKQTIGEMNRWFFVALSRVAKGTESMRLERFSIDDRPDHTGE